MTRLDIPSTDHFLMKRNVLCHYISARPLVGSEEGGFFFSLYTYLTDRIVQKSLRRTGVGWHSLFHRFS